METYYDNVINENNHMVIDEYNHVVIDEYNHVVIVESNHVFGNNPYLCLSRVWNLCRVVTGKDKSLRWIL